MLVLCVTAWSQLVMSSWSAQKQLAGADQIQHRNGFTSAICEDIPSAEVTRGDATALAD